MVLASGDVTGGGTAQAVTPMNSIRTEGWPGLVAGNGGAMMSKRRATKKQAVPEPKWATMPQLRPDAAGLDIGEAEIVACVPCERADEPIRSFGTFTPDLRALVDWLQACGIKTVAMESTGVYWIPLYELLEERGIEAYVVNARHLKNVPGRKTDVCDAQWIQTLHSYGLLAASFLPDAIWRPLRTYWRQRQSLIEHRAPHIQHMQKALHQMNLQLTQVLTDITGVTGLRIIRAIVAGERNPVVLAQFRDRRCRHSAERIAKALTGAYRDEHVFALKQALALYDFYTAQVAECDAQMEQQYAKMLESAHAERDDLPPLGPDPKKNSHSKNAPAFDVRANIYPLTGVDLVAVTGLEESTVQTIIAEIGTDMDRWRTVKHFCSWLGLAPHNDISGGKVLRSKTLKGRNRAGQAFRIAAQSVTRSDTAFGAFFRRLAAHIGVEQAIVATAHKIARTVYAMLKNRLPFQEVGAHEYARRYRQRVIATLTKRAQALGFSLVPQEQAAV
jgi:transposase